MQKRNIVFCLRKNFIENPGGDITQMQSWAKVLRQLGAIVSIHSGAVKIGDLQGVDVVFVWHLERLHESFQPWFVARKLNIPVILAPTCWNHQQPGIVRALAEQVKLWARYLHPDRDKSLLSMLFRSWYNCRQALLHGSAILAVNSNAEREFLLQAGSAADSLRIIPNVINFDEFKDVVLMPWEKRKLIVCIGHFCPRKNQLGVIRALKNTDWHITFIGTARPMHQRYFKLCIEESAGQHEFIGSLPHREVLELLSRARLAICGSFVETPGICNLEAAALGCNVILPNIAPVREYFNGYGFYISPEKIDPKIIGNALIEPPKEELRQTILDNYTESSLLSHFDNLLSETLQR